MSIQTIMRTTIFLVIVLLSTIVGYYLISTKEVKNDTAISDDSQRQSSAIFGEPESNEASQELLTEGVKESTEDVGVFMELGGKRFSEEEVAELNGWLSENGYRAFFGVEPLEIDPLNPHVHLTNDELESMATSDPRISLELGQRHYDDQNLEKAKPHLINAASHGYAWPISGLSRLYGMEARDLMKKGEKSKAIVSFTEMLAWQTVYSTRYFESKKDPYKTIANVVSQTELESIKSSAEERAQELLAMLDQKRLDSGVPSLQIDLPPSVVKFYQPAEN